MNGELLGKWRITWQMANYLEQNVEYVKECAQKNHTYRQISANFKREFPKVNRGFSERNTRLFEFFRLSDKHRLFSEKSRGILSFSQILHAFAPLVAVH